MKSINGFKLAENFTNGYEQLPPSRIHLTCWCLIPLVLSVGIRENERETSSEGKL